MNLLAEWGFQGETLTSANAVIPIAYAVKRGCDIKAIAKDLRLLLVKALLNGVYSRSGDQVLSSMRKAMGEVLKEGGTFQPIFRVTDFTKKVFPRRWRAA